MTVFVTGATGFIGQRLVKRLLAAGKSVTALTRSAAPGLPKEVHVVQGDLLRPETYASAGEGCRRLYHLAALITFDPRRRGELLRVNGDGTAAILDAARRWGVERAVVVSSACTLGLSDRPAPVLDETAEATAAMIAANPYLAGKLRCEEETLRRANEQWAAIVNPTTVFGPEDWTLNSGTLVKQVATARVMPVPPGGSNVVDVDDVVQGILNAGEQGRSGRRYVLGGENLPFAKIVDIIARVTGRAPLRVPLGRWLRRPMMAAAAVAMRTTGNRFLTPQIVGDMFAYKYYSSARARGELDWNPGCRFDDSVERAWTFYRTMGLIE